MISKLVIRILVGGKQDYPSLFKRNELQAILGHGSKNLKTLFYFSLLAFFSVVFAHAGREYLKLRMDNPFIQWLSINVSGDIDRQNIYGAVKNTLEDYAEDGRYSVDDSGGFMRFGIYFIGVDGRELDERITGRTFFEKDELLLRKMLAKENIIEMYQENWSPEQWANTSRKKGIIVTEELWNRVGCIHNGKAKVFARKGDLYPELEVIAVVKSLPDRSMFLTSYELYWGLVIGTQGNASISGRTRETVKIKLANYDEGLADDLPELLRRIEKDGFRTADIQVTALEENTCLYDGELTITFEKEMSDWQCDELLEILTTQWTRHRPRLDIDNEYAYHELGVLEESEESEFRAGTSRNPYTSYTVHFAAVDSIRAFRKELIREYDIDINLEQVEARENFYLVTIITIILAFALAMFTLVSIVMFVKNLLESHLERIKMNLGTFMAFGLDKDFLVRSYQGMVIGILAIVSAASIGLIFIADIIHLPYLILTGLGMDLRADFTESFSVWSPWLGMLLLIIFGSTWWMSKKILSRILDHYPSDLIYNRV